MIATAIKLNPKLSLNALSENTVVLIAEHKAITSIQNTIKVGLVFLLSLISMDRFLSRAFKIADIK